MSWSSIDREMKLRLYRREPPIFAQQRYYNILFASLTAFESHFSFGFNRQLYLLCIEYRVWSGIPYKRANMFTTRLKIKCINALLKINSKFQPIENVYACSDDILILCAIRYNAFAL